MDTQNFLLNFCETHKPYRIFAELRKSVYGQDPELKMIATLLYSWANKMSQSNPENDGHCLNFLIAAESGSGKTTFARALSSMMSPLPVHIVNASAITRTGYRGADYTSMVNFPDMADSQGCGIIIMDELDKILCPSIDGNGYNVKPPMPEGTGFQ